MARHLGKNSVSDKTRDDAKKIARGTQRPGQTKEQTRLIAQGIQKGIEHYKKQQNAKARELDKKLKKAKANRKSGNSPENKASKPHAVNCSKLPWVLLLLSWLCFALFMVTSIL